MSGHTQLVGRRQRLLHALIGAATLLSAACLADPARPGAPTWQADVRPRLARSCLPCHATEDAGRPSLATLADARQNAATMVFAVDAGLMPPGGLDRSGSCQTFLGPAPFTDDDRDVLRAWVEAGMPAGAGGDQPVERDTALPGSDAPRVDRTVELDLPLSATATDEQRCFLVDPGAGEPGYLAGVGIDGAGVVHHAMVFSLSAGAAATARALDRSDPAPGWSCPGVPEPASALLFTWVPGQDVAAFPPGVAAALPTGPLVVQVHQHGATSVATARLSLLILDDAPRTVRMLPVAQSGFSLPAGQPDVTVARTMPAPLEGDALVVGVMPHMHGAGRAATLSVQGGPCLADAPRFDFGWQEIAFYETPLVLQAGVRLSLTCTWDTRDRSAPVRWGESSDDEMCTVFLFVTDPGSGTEP